MKELKPKKALFIDRDGVVNVDIGYVHTKEEFVPIMENLQLIKDVLANDNYIVFIVTNQAGIARGYYTEAKFLEFQAWVEEFLAGEGIKIEKTYYCPHHPTEGKIKKYSKKCDCRKPSTSLLLKAAAEYDIDLKKSMLIGDKDSDMEAGRAVGCAVIKV